MSKNNNENFYKNVCIKYVGTMSKEMLLEKDDKILHIFIDDEYIELKENGEITVDNYTEYLDGSFEVYEYSSYKELFDITIKDEISYDLNDLELFNEKGEWDFYISFEELRDIGYGFMVKDNYPLLEQYAIPQSKLFDFFDYFSLEQLENFEESLHLYLETMDIEDDEVIGLYSKSDKVFNKDIIKLAEHLITYEDFTKDYIEHTPPYYELALSKVCEYFRENQIKNLMNYGSDGDEGLCHLSSMYKEIMDKLSIKYKDVYTEDVSDGKYLTTIIFKDNSKIEIDTSAWNGIKVVTENVESVYETYELLKTELKENNKLNEIELEC